MCPYTGTIFYNIRIYSRSQVSVCRTIGPLVSILDIFSLASPVGFEPTRQRYIASQKPNALLTELSGCPNYRIPPITCIRKTCPCYVYPLIPHFYIAKLGYTGVYLFFLFLLQNIDCGYSLEPPQRGGSNVYPQSMF